MKIWNGGLVDVKSLTEWEYVGELWNGWDVYRTKTIYGTWFYRSNKD